MNKKVSIILFSIGFMLVTNSLLANNLCYRAEKNNFTQSPGTSYDIIFDLRDLKQKEMIHLSFASLLPIPYADDIFSFDCMQNTKHTNVYTCVGDDGGGRIKLQLSDGRWDLNVNVKYARMANTTDNPIIHKIESKKDIFTSTERTACPKPHIFQSRNEKYLPFVCYDYKSPQSDTKKIDYSGCVRYNKACKRLELQHFGRYPNDYESYKALKRCKNSTPDNLTKVSAVSHEQSFHKSKKIKRKLMNTITVPDMDVSDLDYCENLIVAVGQDDSEKTRKLQTQDEYYEAVIVRSLDGGKTWSRVGQEIDSSIPHDTVIVLDSKHILVASSMEGAGGTIILSEDAGKTWKVRYSGGLIEYMKRIKANTIIVKTIVSTLKSIDGGKNWVETPLKYLK